MRTKLPLAFVMLCSSVALAAPNQDPHPQASGAKRVDLVIALDTSSSMDGLIDAARAKLWDVVNLLSHAHPSPILRVGLIANQDARQAIQRIGMPIDERMERPLLAPPGTNDQITVSRLCVQRSPS